MVYTDNCRMLYHLVTGLSLRSTYGRTLPNTDLSRDFIGLVMDGSMDLGTHI